MFDRWVIGQNRTRVDSWKNLKRAVGILGMALPILCLVGGSAFGGVAVQNSISHYYHTNMRDVLVGLLGCAAVMFMTYTGYGWLDNLVSWLIGIAGAGVVVFPCPTYPQVDDAPVGVFQLGQAASGPIHFGFAIAFFLLLALNAIFLFRVGAKKIGDRKRVRNAIYLASGLAIVASLVVLAVLWFAARAYFESSSIALVFETVMLEAFGVAWLVKGGVPGLMDDGAATTPRDRAPSRSTVRAARPPRRVAARRGL